MVSFLPGTHTERAYAKVNLHLHVGLRRSDGYHDITSLFQMIDLYDTVAVDVQPAGHLHITCDPIPGIDPQRNTMVDSALRYAEAVGLTASVRISCEKRIPMQAGLGGGSSDGAAILHLLNRVCGYPLTYEELMHLGAQVGSDVPFFLAGSTVAFVHGRGEHVEPLFPRDDLHAIVVMPHGSAVSTAWAFGELDALRERTHAASKRLEKPDLAAMYRLPVSTWSFTNDFRPVLGELEAVYDALDRLVEETGNCFGTVSGSGSAYCIIAENLEIIGQLQVKLELFLHELCLYVIKCLHREHSGATVSL